MRIVFHGSNAASFAPGFAGLLEVPHEIALLSDGLDDRFDPPRLRHLHDCLQADGFEVSIPTYQSKSTRHLGATTNEQRPLVDQGRFVHMELSESLRADPGGVERLVKSLQRWWRHEPHPD